ncbi:hypothetical protein ABE402_05980 [Bacillus smithii]|uniref:hypothetical protein n=1 Tax=Bacillus smithii TaxID=1479 RepID=UPI003D23D528
MNTEQRISELENRVNNLEKKAAAATTADAKTNVIKIGDEALISRLVSLIENLEKENRYLRNEHTEEDLENDKIIKSIKKAIHNI